MSRTKYLLKNAKINTSFFVLNALITFFSRKIFIQNLGADFLGLNATISNLLGFLSLAELGVGTAVTYLLYQPLAEKNFLKINEIISVLNYFYKRTSLIILAFGLSLGPFLIYFFAENTLSTTTIYFTFYIYLSINLIEYFFNFRQIVVYADQQAFLIKKIIGICSILKIATQILAIYTLRIDVYTFLTIEFFFAIFKSIIINKMISRKYHWLQPIKSLKSKIEDRKTVITKTKQIFSHQVASFVLTQTDQIFIYLYTSLSMVTYYSNYLMVVQYAVILLNQPFASLNSSVGNLIVTSSKEKSFQIFTELLVLKHWIAGISIFTIYITINPFIEIWLGKEFILNQKIITVLLINFFIVIIRKPLDLFLQAFGIFHDTWAPWLEASLNLVLSALLGYYLGIYGILLGTSISVALMVFLWKPYLLFKNGFHKEVSLYWKKTISLLLLFFSISIFIKHLAFFSSITISKSSILNLTMNLILISISFILVYSFSISLIFKEGRQLLKRISNLRN